MFKATLNMVEVDIAPGETTQSGASRVFVIIELESAFVTKSVFIVERVTDSEHMRDHLSSMGRMLAFCYRDATIVECVCQFIDVRRDSAVCVQSFNHFCCYSSDFEVCVLFSFETQRTGDCGQR